MRDALYGGMKSCTDTRIVSGKGRASPLKGGRIPRRHARPCSRAPVQLEQPLASPYRHILQVSGSLPGRVSSMVVPSLSTVCLPSVNRSEEHTSELQSLMRTSYAVFCLK